MPYFRAGLFYLGIYSVIGLIMLFSPLFLLTPHTVRYFYMTRWGRFTIWWLKLTCGLDFKVEGKENIPEQTCIILANHQSAWETIVMQQIFPRQTWVLKRELLWLPFFGWGLAMMFPIAIDRAAGKRALKQVISQGIDRLRRGLWIVIFPEGTRLPPGGHRKYALGGAMLAEKSGHPIVPVCHNAGEFWPRDSFLKRPGTITLVIGKPIDPHGKRASELNDEAERWIRDTYSRITTLPALPDSIPEQQ